MSVISLNTSQVLVEIARRAKAAVILRGISGSGKGDFVQVIREHIGNIRHCSADTHRYTSHGYDFNPQHNDAAHQACIRDFIEAVRMDNPYDVVVVENTNVYATDVAPYIAVARAFGWDPMVLTFPTSPEAAFKNTDHNVPFSKLEYLNQRLQEAECHLPPHWTHFHVRQPRKD